ncbi:presqualene diphosphate synthase HpnD [Plantactinospora sp. KBS50]|uniref:presqualene diphosphate synthase HpnD n=1 Tax=Plantactinospora sp. KBS50 TaxID=2024580 RepID=UPI000BAAB2CB|nr:presqualene diphosphate synthase HpnD [Plantactinospora sp. KBS50]ASW55162.1 squalene synthase HpnD [Plantactinospora sp. KBS50]
MTATAVPAVAAAYRECERITRTQARNFSYGIRLLRPDRRAALSAVYAIARRIDDIGDGDLPAATRLAQLDQVRAALHRLPDGGDDPVYVALADAAARLPIPLAALDELVDGCVADVRGTRYEDFDQLVGYCRCVAGSIGRLSLGVFDLRPGVDREHAAGLADALGIALQLTNILRDIVEDRLTGRIYLPAADLRRFGCTLELAPGGLVEDPPQRLADLVRFQARRAETHYRTGLALLPLLDRRSAACVAAMAGIYHRLLERIFAEPLAVTHRRVSLPGWEKAYVAARAMAGSGA